MLQTKTNSKVKTFTSAVLEMLPTLIAITTLIFAVCTTLASFKAAGYGNRMVLSQNQASDQWTYYQAKSLKETVYQTQRDMLELSMLQSNQPEVYREKIAQYDKEIQRYKQEKEAITTDAKLKEKDRDTAKQFNMAFGQALIFLQIGILLSSLAAISKIPFYWYASLLSGGVGIVMFFSTYLQTM